jgi:hypothetical protein
METLVVHVFVRTDGVESKFMCGAPAFDVRASVSIEWAKGLMRTKLMCPECRKRYEAESLPKSSPLGQ